MTNIRSVYIASAVSVLLGAAGLRADVPMVDFTSVNNNFTNNAWSLGWSFTTNISISVSGLGYYNASLTSANEGPFGPSNVVGLSPGCNCGDVGIFNSAGNLLVSAQVTGSDQAIGFFNYAPITPLVLAGGQKYYILAETGSSDYTWDVNGLTVSPNITFDGDAFVQSPTLAFGTTSIGFNQANGGGFFGPNFLDSPAAPASTPEPTSLLLLGTVLFATVGALRLRRRAAASGERP